MSKLHNVPFNFRFNEKALTASATLTRDDYFVYVDATSGNITVTLPPVTEAIVLGQVLHISKVDNSANTVTIDGSGSETINGSTTQVISTSGDSLMIHASSTQAEWRIN